MHLRQLRQHIHKTHLQPLQQVERHPWVMQDNFPQLSHNPETALHAQQWHVANPGVQATGQPFEIGLRTEPVRVHGLQPLSVLHGLLSNHRQGMQLCHCKGPIAAKDQAMLRPIVCAGTKQSVNLNSSASYADGLCKVSAFSALVHDYCRSQGR